MSKLIDVELVFATPDRQVLLAMQVASGVTVADVIAQSGVHQEFPDVQLGELEFGIWGKLVAQDHVVHDGDRIEINVPENRLQLLISDEELQQRQKTAPVRPDHPATGMLKAYRQNVRGADQGAIWI